MRNEHAGTKRPRGGGNDLGWVACGVALFGWWVWSCMQPRAPESWVTAPHVEAAPEELRAHPAGTRRDVAVAGPGSNTVAWTLAPLREGRR